MLRIGETSNMNTILDEIVYYLKQKTDIARKIKSNMFTVKVMFVGLVILIIVAIYMLGRMKKIFDSPIQSCIHAGFPSTDQTKVLRKKYYISKNRLNKIQPIFTNHIFSDNCFSFIMAFLLRCFHFITELS